MSNNEYDQGRLNLPFVGICTFGKYPYIQEGDKIKFLHMIEPNIYQSSAISFMTELPKELDFQKIIDYNTQFEKSFIEPLKFITDKILWKIDSSYGTQGTLEDFFT